MGATYSVIQDQNEVIKPGTNPGRCFHCQSGRSSLPGSSYVLLSLSWPSLVVIYGWRFSRSSGLRVAHLCVALWVDDDRFVFFEELIVITTAGKFYVGVPVFTPFRECIPWAKIHSTCLPKMIYLFYWWAGWPHLCHYFKSCPIKLHSLAISLKV